MDLAPWRPTKRAGPGRHWLAGLSALLALLLALLLAACGASSAHNSGASGGSASSIGPGGGVMAIRPCQGDYSGGLHPALTLSNSGSVSGRAHVGDIVEIRLDGHHHTWTLASIKPESALVSRGGKGVLDRTDGACVWDFQATEPANVIITYEGVPLCDPTQVCPDNVISQNFTIYIS